MFENYSIFELRHEIRKKKDAVEKKRLQCKMKRLLSHKSFSHSDFNDIRFEKKIIARMSTELSKRMRSKNV